jgi:1,3-beta-glucanosyltransferase GAS1
MLTNLGLVNVMGNTVEETPDYSSLSSQLASATPSSTPIGKWPTTTKDQIPCPTLDRSWSADTVLPPIPSEGICACMLQSLKCVGGSNITEQASIDALEILCGEDGPKSECFGASGNGTTGKYGAYRFNKLSLVQKCMANEK